MNPNWLGLISAALAFVAFLVTYRLCLQLAWGKRAMLVVATGLLAIPGASFAFYYTHWLPETAWYYEFRSWPGTELLMIFVGAAGGAVASLLPRVLLVIPLLGVAAFAIVPTLKPILGPMDMSVMQDQWDEDVCLQSTGSTCGLASAATILNRHGIRTTEGELAREAHTYTGGTEAWYLARALRARGLEVHFHFSNGLDAKTELPAIIGVRIGPIGHFIPVLEREGDKYCIGDPMRGREWLSQPELTERYEFTGFAMVIRSQDI